MKVVYVLGVGKYADASPLAAYAREEDANRVRGVYQVNNKYDVYWVEPLTLYNHSESLKHSARARNRDPAP